MRNNRAAIFAVFGFLLASLPLLAHHGNAAFDSEKRLTMKGTVTEWAWANPHCFLQFDVTDDHGQMAHWIVETSNPADMVNAGWNKQSLKAGDQVTVTVMPVKNGQPIGRVVQVVLPSGQQIGGGFAATPLPANAQPGAAAGSKSQNNSKP